jgi:N-acyl-D-aspartate/D-glutamate deacylase
MKRGWLLIFVLVSVAGLAGLQAQQPAYDIVIHGGMIVDGSGNPWYRADLGIQDGRIAHIGSISPAAGARSIDASGKAVSPGFIDLHTHSDIPLLIDGTAQSRIRQGVTLDVIGESRSIAPLEGVVWDDYRENVGRRYNFTDVDWRTVEGYFNRLERQGISINVATSVAPQQVKRAVVGYEDRAATGQELERMKQLVAQAMREGAVGLSSAFGGGGYDNAEEIFEMAKVAAEAGGYYGTHVGSEGYQLVEEVSKAIRVAEVARIPVHIYHFKIRGRNLWGQVEPAIELIEAARGRGLEITANQYPYTAMSHPWGALFPSWARSGPPGQIVELLKDKTTREKLKQDAVFKQYVEEHGGWEGSVGSGFKNPALKPFDGMTIAEIAKIRGDQDPADTCFDLIVEDGGFPNGIWRNMSEDDVQRIMRLPWVAIASDGAALRKEGVLGQGLPHPRSFGTNPRVLRKYVREEGVLTLEDAVRKMTSFPAQILRLADRGLLREGYWADVVVFDPETVKDQATFEAPKQYPIGVDHVLVNGVVVIDNGEHTGARPGKPIYGPGHDSSTHN